MATAGSALVTRPDPLPRPAAARSAEPAPDVTDLRILYPRPGRVALVSRTLFGDPAGSFCRGFVARLFSVPEVESLTIDAGRAEIRYAADQVPLPVLVRRIAAALCATGRGGAPGAALDLSAPGGAPVRVRRYGRVLSTWEIRHALPGRVRLRHAWLRRHRGIADVLVEELSFVPGVLDCRVSVHAGSLLVLHDPRRLGREGLLRSCEAALQKATTRAAEAPSAVRFGVGTLLLGLAMAGYYIYPPLAVACALLLVGANVDTFRRAGRALRGGTLDVDVAYSTLISLSLLAGDFRSIALTAWCVRSWPLLLDRRLAVTRRALAGDPRRLARTVVLQRAGRQLVAPAAALRPGDVTVVEAGQVLPADGMVIEGKATIDERIVTGESAAADKKAGQPVYAGARVETGRLVVEVTRGDRDAVVTVMRRHLLEAARVTPGDSAPGKALGDRTATPVLALSALGGITGGLGTSMAVLAPNYTAGPGLANSMDRSSSLLACASAGFLVRDEQALERLAAAGAVIVDAGADAEAAEALSRGLRARGIARVLVVGPEAGRDTARLLRRLRRDGGTVAFVGQTGAMAAARQADVSIAVGWGSRPELDEADVVMVSRHLPRVLELLDLTRAHARHARLTRRLGLWPNVLAVGGALVIGSIALHSSCLTNLGALAVYWRGSTRLGDAEAAWRPGRP